MRLSNWFFFFVVEEYELCKQSYYNLISLCALLLSAFYVCDVSLYASIF